MGLVYEGVILFGVLWLANYLFSTLTTYRAEAGTMRVLFQLFQVLVLGAYFVGFWSFGRRTLPMKTLELQLVDHHGRHLSPQRAALRYIAALLMMLAGLALVTVHPLAVLAIFIPAAWAIFDDQRRALYDIVAGTMLVVEPLKRASDQQSGAVKGQ